jgi:multicomponent K+:H+ antiporter subunit D
MVFWRASEAVSVGRRADTMRVVATFGLLLSSVLLVVAAHPIQAYMQATAAQLFDLPPYLQIIGGEG